MTNDETVHGLVSDQIAYYRARAAEYDEWFFRQGRYDRGPEHRDQWIRELDVMNRALAPVVRGKRVLEFACGTGLWTERLARLASHVVAIDASPEAIAINRDRVRSSNVEYRVADLFAWRPADPFDVVFFAFWLSHVPPTRFDRFWETVRLALALQGQAFFLDSLLEQTSTARDHMPLDQSGTVRRKLNDGREFRIVKVFYQPASLQQRLSEGGWSGWVQSTDTFFLYGQVAPERGRAESPKR